MSAVRLPKSLVFGAVCALAVLLCGGATLCADDYLKKFKAKTDLGSQKLQSDVKGLIAGALQLQKTNPQGRGVCCRPPWPAWRVRAN